jgi:DNA-binding transcriptional regulator YiaG
VPTVRIWTGREAAALRTAMRLSVRAFAEHLGVAVRTVSKMGAARRRDPAAP